MALLEASGISKRFGGIVALADVSIHLEEKESVGLIGPNGAGKTTLFDCLTGLVRPDSGTVVFEGTSIGHLPPYRRSRLGISRTFQRLELFSGMTPREHLIVTERVRSGKGRLWKDLVGLGRPTAREQRSAIELLGLVGLDGVADVPVDALSLGHARLVELARALVGPPKLLMLDEPSSGLSDAERDALVSVLQRVRSERGTTILIVEHDLELVATVASRLVVLESGRLIADGPVQTVMAAAEVRRAYLGDEPVSGKRRAGSGSSDEHLAATARPRQGGTAESKPLLEFRDVEASYGPYHALFGVSFVVPEGSAVALVGSNGAGKSTVARVASGLVRSTAGTVIFDGHDITGWPAWHIARQGLEQAPEGRSVFASLSVEDNLRIAFRGAVGQHGENEALERAYSSFGRLAERRTQLAGTLSGGEQRMLSLAKALAVPRRLLIVDELSLGLAPSLLDDVYAALEAIRASGTSLLVVEQHAQRVLEMADGVVVLVRGRVVR
ncbi:MAG TPA: ATP-binding cassette domain-containing protein, partial [Acidimicrobiales bacterium]|nr:ATP-binding cassette domain-containing protein [Acidimicrobiales bacterium]